MAEALDESDVGVQLELCLKMPTVVTLTLEWYMIPKSILGTWK